QQVITVHVLGLGQRAAALADIVDLAVAQRNSTQKNFGVGHDPGIGQYLFSRHGPAPWGSYQDNGRQWHRAWRHRGKWRSAPNRPPWLRRSVRSQRCGWRHLVTPWVRPARAPANAP